MPGFCVGVCSGSAAEHALQLVGAERQHRREAREQQCRDGDEASTAGNRVHETGKKCGQRQQQENFETCFKHVQGVASGKMASCSTTGCTPQGGFATVQEALRCGAMNDRTALAKLLVEPVWKGCT